MVNQHLTIERALRATEYRTEQKSVILDAANPRIEDDGRQVILQTNIVVLVWPGGIMCLKERRVRGDMIEVYKLLTGKEQIDSGFFTLAQPHYSLRGHEKKS